MKNVIKLSLLGLAAAAVGCTKMASSPSSGSSGAATLTASVTDAAKGQPVTVTAPSSLTADIRWSVSPANNSTTIMPGKGSAVVYFGAPGKYTVFAGYSRTGADSTADTCIVVVGDSTYTPPPPPNYDTTGLAHDSIFITPMLDSTGRLFLIARTAASYPGFPTLLYSSTQGPDWSAGISIDFYGIVSQSGTGAVNEAYAYLYLPGLPSPPADGSYPLQITVNSTVYTGSITVTGNAYEFYWPDTRGVIFYPTSVSR